MPLKVIRALLEIYFWLIINVFILDNAKVFSSLAWVMIYWHKSGVWNVSVISVKDVTTSIHSFFLMVLLALLAHLLTKICAKVDLLVSQK